MVFKEVHPFLDIGMTLMEGVCEFWYLEEGIGESRWPWAVGLEIQHGVIVFVMGFIAKDHIVGNSDGDDGLEMSVRFFMFMLSGVSASGVELEAL